jgi:hypothetical protein
VKTKLNPDIYNFEHFKPFIIWDTKPYATIISSSEFWTKIDWLYYRIRKIKCCCSDYNIS